MPEGLGEDVRGRLEAAAHQSWDRDAVPRARNYMLRWARAAELSKSLEEAHHAAIRAAHRKSVTSRRSHSSAIVDGLNRILGLGLPQPAYGLPALPATPEPGENGVRDTEANATGFKVLIEALREGGLHFPSEAVANYVLALQTKRFAILTGISGTGKTQIARAVARCFGAAIRGLRNYEVVPVRPDWVDNRGLLGYLNPITGIYSVTPFLSLLLEAREEEIGAGEEARHPHPFFVVLDEMNLARVEHYFSDFLSALESDEPIPLHDDQAIEDGSAESGVPVPRRLRVPKNVFFTGTVNVDETTYMFSPKVLDRAFTIAFDRVDLAGYADGVVRDDPGDLDLSAGWDGGLRLTPYKKPQRDHWLDFVGIASGRYARTLVELHTILEGEHRHFGYRVANEIARFVNLAREQSANGDESVKAAFDLALLQKVLPKFHGTQQELEPLLERLFDFAVDGVERGHGDAGVQLDEWTVANGRLRPKGSTVPPTGVPAGASQRDADGSAGETEEVGAGDGPDAGDGAAGRRDPEFPRTAAKIWRMLRRLRQRGFTAFIE